jgi:hypothetical protein
MQEQDHCHWIYRLETQKAGVKGRSVRPNKLPQTTGNDEVEDKYERESSLLKDILLQQNELRKKNQQVSDPFKLSQAMDRRLKQTAVRNSNQYFLTPARTPSRSDRISGENARPASDSIYSDDRRRGPLHRHRFAS